MKAHRISKATFSTLLLLSLSFPISNALAGQANVEARLEGAVVTPDTINGLAAMVIPNQPIRIVLSMSSELQLETATVGLSLYSPDNSVDSVELVTALGALEAWPNDLFLGGVLFNEAFDGELPESFLAGWVTVGVLDGVSYFGPTPLVDVVDITLSFPEVENGIVCLDSAFFPPAGEWGAATTDGSILAVDWGGTSGGYPDGGLCFTVSSEVSCCQLAGDANHSGSVNITDAIYIQNYMYWLNDADPPCLAEADADGSGRVNIRDVTYIIRYIFSGGSAPMCGTAGL